MAQRVLRKRQRRENKLTDGDPETRSTRPLRKKRRISVARIVKKPQRPLTYVVRDGAVITINRQCAVMPYIHSLRNYLADVLKLREDSSHRTLRYVAAFFSDRYPQGPCTSFNPALLCDWIKDSIRPGGFYDRRKGSTKANTLQTMMRSMKQFLIYLSTVGSFEEHYEVISISQDLLNDAIKGLKDTVITERAELEHEISQNLMDSSIIVRFEQLEYVKRELTCAAECLTDSNVRPDLIGLFCDLRNLLMAIFVITSFRSISDIIKFSLKEATTPVLLERKTLYKYTFSSRETRAKAPILLSNIENKALRAYLKHYRPLVSQCSGPDCAVFCCRLQTSLPSSSTSDGPPLGPCCQKMSFTNVTKSLKLVFEKAGLPTDNITCRSLRSMHSSQVRKVADDNCQHKHLAALGGPSLHTQTRRYDYSHKLLGMAGIKKSPETVRIRNSLQPCNSTHLISDDAVDLQRGLIERPDKDEDDAALSFHTSIMDHIAADPKLGFSPFVVLSPLPTSALSLLPVTPGSSHQSSPGQAVLGNETETSPPQMVDTVDIDQKSSTVFPADDPHTIKTSSSDALTTSESSRSSVKDRVVLNRKMCWPDMCILRKLVPKHKRPGPAGLTDWRAVANAMHNEWTPAYLKNKHKYMKKLSKK